jgi:hypothetical protein
MMKFLKDARLQLTLSMVVFGTIGLFVRNISLASGEIALYRAVMATVLVGFVLLFTGQRIDFAKIKKELDLLLTDLGRLSDRAGNVARHFGQIENDIEQLQTSVSKITPRAEKLRDMDFGEE